MTEIEQLIDEALQLVHETRELLARCAQRLQQLQQQRVRRVEPELQPEERA